MAKSGILAKSQDLQESFGATTGQITIGIDLGDRFSYCCVLGPDGTVLTEGRVVSTPEGMTRHFQQLPATRIAFEVGSHSRWVSELLTSWGHEVILANPRNLRLISDAFVNQIELMRRRLRGWLESIRNCYLRSCTPTQKLIRT